MYLRHFTFTRFPYAANLEADELLASTARQEAEARLTDPLELRGIRLLTGEVGCGKTAVCRHVTANLHPGLFRVFYVLRDPPQSAPPPPTDLPADPDDLPF